MSREVEVIYTVEQDEDGVWCAHALVGRVGCNGYGDTQAEAVQDLREAVLMVLEDDGPPETLHITLGDVA
jgi:predicted RNase H-like HicB family nuclease